MEIKGISNSQYLPKDVNNTKGNVEQGPKPTDKLEISAEAKKLNEEKEMQKLEMIKQRIADKFYDSDFVLNKVAGSILNEITSGK